MALFDKAIIFTDIHFGLKSDSQQHNTDCLDFITWMINSAQSRGIDTAIFCGDYFHNRKYISSTTLTYGMQGLSLLNNAFKKVYFLVGNHDMYYKNRRDINSTTIAALYPNIEFISDITTFDDCAFVPFLIDDEHHDLPKLKSKFVFGHFELPGYMLNSVSLFPDHGRENEDMFNCEMVISGHFHNRQVKKSKNGTKIVYAGNCFAHNYGDAWDDARGAMILDNTGEHQFLSWPDAPKYRTGNYSDAVNNPDKYYCDQGMVRIMLDVPVGTDEIASYRESIRQKYNLRDLVFCPVKTKIDDIDEDKIEDVEDVSASVDTIVINQLRSVTSNTLDPEMLVLEYLELNNDQI